VHKYSNQLAPLPAAPMSKTPTQLKDLAVGDLIMIHIVVNIADIADPKSKTRTKILYMRFNLHVLI